MKNAPINVFYRAYALQRVPTDDYKFLIEQPVHSLILTGECCIAGSDVVGSESEHKRIALGEIKRMFAWSEAVGMDIGKGHLVKMDSAYQDRFGLTIL